MAIDNGIVTVFGNLKDLKIAYTTAIHEEKEVFIYEGVELLTNHAKYLIEYLELKQGNKL